MSMAEGDSEAGRQNRMREMMLKLKVEGPDKGKKSQRKAKEKEIQGAVDRRSLRAKGRTEQFNTNIRPDIKAAILARVPRGGIADWVEAIFERELGLRGQ